MNLKDIYNKTWRVSNNLTVRKIRVNSLCKEEQEFNVNVLKAGYDDINEKEIHVTCSFQEWITTLYNSEYFELREVLISIHPDNEGFILEVQGKLDYNGLTIRKKKREYSEEEKKILAERMKANIHHKGDKN